MSKTGHRGSRLRRAEHETPIEKIFTSNRYLSLDDQEEIDVYARYLTYRVQRDLYELCQAEDGGLPDDWSWDDFVLTIRSVKMLRNAAIAACWDTQRFLP